MSSRTEEKAFNVFDDMKHIPKFAQTQRSLEEQLSDARAILNRVGLYDASDFLFRQQRTSK